LCKESMQKHAMVSTLKGFAISVSLFRAKLVNYHCAKQITETSAEQHTFRALFHMTAIASPIAESKPSIHYCANFQKEW
jgi:hypothetical protein